MKSFEPAYWQKPRNPDQNPAVASLEQALDHVDTFEKAIEQYRSIMEKYLSLIHI